MPWNFIISPLAGSRITSPAETLAEVRMLLMGMVNRDPPTLTSMPSMMAMVRGIFSVVVMPLPHSLEMDTVPPTSATFFLTTSMPTPRPENSVTWGPFPAPSRR